MRHGHAGRFRGSEGFTLVESIIVMVLLGIAAATIISMQGNIFYGQSENKDLQVGVQLMQECAEQIFATRRRAGYTSALTTSCLNLVAYGGFDLPSVTKTDNNGNSPCASASSTCTVVISLSKGGSSLTPIILRLTKY